MRDRAARQQLLLRKEKTLNETHGQTLMLKVVKLAFGVSLRIRKMTRALSKDCPSQTKKEINDSQRAGTAGGPATFEISAPQLEGMTACL
jgi:hypothetical protein